MGNAPVASSSKQPISHQSYTTSIATTMPRVESPKDDPSMYATPNAGPSSQSAARHQPDMSVRSAPPIQSPQRKSSAHSQGGRYEGEYDRWRISVLVLMRLELQDRHRYHFCFIPHLLCREARSRNTTSAITKHGN